MEERHAFLSINKNVISSPFENLWTFTPRSEDQGKLGRGTELSGDGNLGWYLLGNIYPNSIKEYKTLRNYNFHTARKEVAWILNMVAEKVWMQSVFNLKILTAEHGYWVYRLEVFWAWINNAGRNCYLSCQYLPTTANEVHWIQEEGLTATAADHCPEKLHQQLTQPQCPGRPLSKLHKPELSEPLMAYSSFSGWLSLQCQGANLCTCHVSWNQQEIWPEHVS